MTEVLPSAGAAGAGLIDSLIGSADTAERLNR